MAPATLLLLLTLLAGDTKDSARQLVRQARSAFDLGHFDEAASRYEAAYRIVPDAALLFNMGQAYRLGGRREQALAAYLGFLRTAPPGDPNRAAVEARIAELQKALTPPPEPAPRPTAPTPEAPRPRPEPPPPPPPLSPAVEPGPELLPPTLTEPEPAPPPEDRGPRFHTAAGANLGWAGRGDAGALNYQAFGRLTDPGGRTYELGYSKRPLYPMNPIYQYTGVYAVFRSPSHWMAEAGALGVAGEWHLGAGYTTDIFEIGARVERADPTHLCADEQATLVYFVPRARLQVPVTEDLRILADGDYRGKLWTSGCAFHPSLLELELGADYRLPGGFGVRAGIGHYGLFDFGSGAPDGVWPNRSNAAEGLHLGGRYTLGQINFTVDYRLITYAGGTHQLTFGVELRSDPEAR